MTLIKTSFWSGIAIFIKVATGFFISKIFALYSGPAGLAMMGQLQNLIQAIQGFSGSLIQQGIVKYVAEYHQQDEKKYRLLSSAILISLIISLICGVTLFFLRSYIANHILKIAAYNNIITALSLTLILFSLNGFLLSILNGEREIIKYNLCIIINSIAALAITAYLIFRYSLFGGLLSLVFNQSIVFFLTLAIVAQCKWFKLKNLCMASILTAHPSC